MKTNSTISHSCARLHSNSYTPPLFSFLPGMRHSIHWRCPSCWCLVMSLQGGTWHLICWITLSNIERPSISWPNVGIWACMSLSLVMRSGISQVSWETCLRWGYFWHHIGITLFMTNCSFDLDSQRHNSILLTFNAKSRDSNSSHGHHPQRADKLLTQPKISTSYSSCHPSSKEDSQQVLWTNRYLWSLSNRNGWVLFDLLYQFFKC